MSSMRLVVLFALLSLLSACGGGGGGVGGSAVGGVGGGSTTPPVANSWLQFTPATVELFAVEGHTRVFTVTAKSSRTIAQAFNVGVVDAKGIITTDVSVTKWSASEYEATLHVSDKLAPGTYSGQLEVRLCEDSPATCAKPIEGSPWMVPIKVTVYAATKLTALSASPQLGPWTTVGGNSRHTGYAPLTLDPAKFSVRWDSGIRPSGPGGMSLVDGVVYFSAQPGPDVIALEEATGKNVWTARIPPFPSCYPPGTATVAGGKAFVTCPDRLMAYESGKVLYSYIEYDTAPLAIGTELYFYGHSGAVATYDIVKLDTGNGTALWKSSLQAYPFQTLTADDQFLYLFDAQLRLNTFRLTDGTLVSSALKTSDCYQTNTPTLGPAGQLFAACLLPGGSPQLFAYDTVAKKQLWAVSLASRSDLALVGTTLYVVNGNSLEARDTADGTVKWSTVVEPFSGAAMATPRYLLATDNLVFVSGGSGVVAVDIASKKVVWNLPYGGPISLSSTGVLYLPFPTLIAVNLR